ncbi:MAG: winged helix-turn-helix domain-containing protein [Janthinobacterium lividum]
MDKQTKEAIKQMQTEMRQLHALISDSHTEQKTEAPASVTDEHLPAAKSKSESKSEGGITYNIHRPSLGEGDIGYKTGTITVSAAQLLKATDEAAALLGYALSSPQKVGLLRALLGHDSESAAALGTAAQLSTGSLYHHLRDLMHAGLIAQEGRNRYQITPRGQRVLLMLLALSVE